jgi:hypothetical protein
MRKGFLLVLVLLTLLLVAAGVVFLRQRQTQSVAVPTVSPQAVAAVPRVTVDALQGQLAASSPPLVWDFRPTSTFAEGHIRGSRVLTLDAIPDAAAGLDKTLPIVTVCA